jgi:hypothetical protein
VFLHYRSSITRDEYEAFKAACPADVKAVAIRVRTDRNGVQLHREGTYPLIRGTFWKVNDSTCYLWASGFKPRLGTYDGAEVPAPLRIDIEYGKAELKQVAKDILGLTKLQLFYSLLCNQIFEEIDGSGLFKTAQYYKLMNSIRGRYFTKAAESSPRYLFSKNESRPCKQ